MCYENFDQGSDGFGIVRGIATVASVVFHTFSPYSWNVSACNTTTLNPYARETSGNYLTMRELISKVIFDKTILTMMKASQI